MAAIVDTNEIDWTGSVNGKARGGNAQFKPLFQGESRARDNFEFVMGRMMGKSNFSPRHHHNFDQFRFCLKGAMNFSPGMDVPLGQVGYFPEGAYYGPQEIAVGTEWVLLQLGGGSGDGFMAYDDQRRGAEELATRGAFDKGVFTYLDAEGRKQRRARAVRRI